MATAAQVIEKLQARGVILEAIDGNLKVIGTSRLTDQEKAILKDHKSALLAYLTASNGDTEKRIAELPEFIHTESGTARTADLIAELRPWLSDLDDFLNDPLLQVAFASCCICSGTIKPVTDHEY